MDRRNLALQQWRVEQANRDRAIREADELERLVVFLSLLLMAALIALVYLAWPG